MKHKPNTLASKRQGKKQKKGVYTESQALTRGNPPEGHGSSWSAARTHPPCGLAWKDELHQPQCLLENLQLEQNANGDQASEP